MAEGPRRRGPERAFTDEQIVGVALDLLDEHGPDALSVRRIAAKMGLAPNAIYTYFPDKQAILRAVVDRIVGERDTQILNDTDAPWRERIVRVSLDIRTRLLAHPGSALLFMSAPIDGPNSLALGEGLLGALAEAGLDAADAARASYAVIVYVLGSVALEASELDPTVPLPAEADRIAERRGAFAAVPAEWFPRTAAVTDVMAAYIGTEQFTWGLERLLDGFAARGR
ncbi:TetR/AcrR family transcriptional regulator [Agromyces protaetiae]|uniref:TetR/AcrR family transcriptional regulator n=1 Tax=Agromyces protaetiae TaxID=2509455 RepID=A0A4P6FED9_9MICO|nr:TetR/AcrR family transcriptional regulator [Agromyces protaetiae]QAY72047.1 TetR/AcrR family transcriptional regulator [Agromyces protaetiae]